MTTRGCQLASFPAVVSTAACTIFQCSSCSMPSTADACCTAIGHTVVAVHPGVADSTWYLKSDNDSYLFSWLVDKARSILGPEWVRVGQPLATGAISIIYASIDPSLTGSTSSPRSTGIIDSIVRTLFGGRLRYYGPSYIPLFLNWNNAGRCYAWNPWVYNKEACSRLYDSTLRLIKDVERQLAGQQQQEPQPPHPTLS